MKYAIQLYSVRDEITDKESFINTLKTIKNMGYEGVEFAGYYGLLPEEMNSVLQDVGLKAISAHESIERFEKNLEEILDYISKVDVKDVAIAHSPCDSIEEINRTVSTLTNAKIKAEKYGIKISYHNHAHEFMDIQGIIPMEEIAKCSYLEVDTFWSFVAGLDSVKFIEDNKDIISYLHIKDGNKEKKYPSAIGEGENDIKAIVNMAKKLNHEWVIVENDNPIPSGLKDIERSINWLKENI